LSTIGLVVTASSALAQLSTEDLDRLREQGMREGWTFTVGMSDAVRRPLQDLAGLVPTADARTPYKFDSTIPKQITPADFNWCDLGGCPSVRDQAGCGSCWAFTAIGAMESAILISEEVLVDLSEQALVSCRSGGCAGGSFAVAFDRLRCEGPVDPCGESGAVPESFFPYQAANVDCTCPFPHPYCIEDWAFVGDGYHTPNLAQIKRAIMTYGPVATGVHVTGSFQAYAGGVFNACDPVSGINHAVVLVGWDDAQGTNGVWIVRNSWGADWGENGYMRLEYGCLSIASEVCYVDYHKRDCNGNEVSDLQELALESSDDCNVNGIPDECDIASGTSWDQNGDGAPDECVTLYVDADATGSSDGRSWANAHSSLQDALVHASDSGWFVQEIRVAEGKYTPDRGAYQIPGDQSATFHLRSGVVLKGGYAGTGSTNPNIRDVRRYRSVLSGDLRGDDGSTVRREDNSYHVLTGSRAGSSAVLDGFTIEGGNAVANDPFDRGGGMYNLGGRPTLINCTFRGNTVGAYGGAMYNGNFGSPSLTNCLFDGNRSEFHGGGVYNFNRSDPTFTGCIFKENTAGYAGGGLLNFASSPLLINCLFDGNAAVGYGGGMLHYAGSAPTVNSCTIYGCSAESGGGIYSYASSLTLLNSILWANVASQGPAAASGGDSILDVAFSDVEGGEAALHATSGSVLQWGEGNMDVSPIFVPGPTGAYYLSHVSAGDSTNSPCSGAGSATSASLGLSLRTTRSDERVDVEVVDLGYHYPLTHVPLATGDFDRDRDVDVADFAAFQICFARLVSGGVSPACRIFDTEPDGDVDLDDLSAVMGMLSTPR